MPDTLRTLEAKSPALIPPIVAAHARIPRCEPAYGPATGHPDTPTLDAMGEKGQDVQRRGGQPSGGEPVYGLGMIGAWVYYWRSADTNGDRALGILKGFVWPAFLVYEAFSAVGRANRPE